jgi:Tol biopolymer transport system component
MGRWLAQGATFAAFVSLLGCQSSPTTNWAAETIGFTRSSQVGGIDQLWLMNGDGSDPSQLDLGTEGNRYLTWAPDGNAIAFESVRDGNREIYTARIVRTGDRVYSVHELQRRTSNPADDGFPVWSHDCARLAFSSDRANPGYHNIYQLDLSTNAVTPMTSGNYDDVSPSWSPDGTKVVFTRKAGDASGEIYVHAMNSGQDRRLTNNRVNDADPSWSPSGRIIFARHSEDGRRSTLFEMDPVDVDGDGNGDHLTQITRPSDNQHDQKPEYFRSGKTVIFFRSEGTGGPGDVWRLLIQDGTVMEPVMDLTETTPQHEHGATWKPNGVCVRKGK